MEDKKLNIAVIGCGEISTVHFAVISSCNIVKLVAVCDIIEEKAKAKADIYGCNYYCDYKEMLKKEDIDVVHICTPHYLHSEMAIFSAELKKHIILEKPVSINIKDAYELKSVIEKNNVYFTLVFQNRHNNSSIFVKDLLTKNEMGKIKDGLLILAWNRVGNYYKNSNWKGTWDKEGGGIIINQAIHSFDLVNWFVESDYEYIEANINNRIITDIEVEDSSEGLIKYKNGVNINYYLINYYSSNRPVMIELQCENGIIQHFNDSACVKFNDGREQWVYRNNNEVIDYGSGVKDYWGVSHSKHIIKFYNSIINKSKIDVDINEAIKTQEIIDGIYKSAKEKTKYFKK
ncbi:MAG: hypothetical protein A2Y34_08885 [Spirochaetes bacterium GWC1_27_15]|nr:MAG: hypothetical protein A2Y34_08885 [Spirochaetes bacterium GWC1_27_15]